MEVSWALTVIRTLRHSLQRSAKFNEMFVHVCMSMLASIRVLCDLSWLDDVCLVDI